MEADNVYSGCIYKFENLIDHTVYIGQTSNPTNRYRQHTYKSTKTQFIDKAINEFGIDNFSYTELVWIKRSSYEEYHSEICALEEFYIKRYKSLGYNMYNKTEDTYINTWASYNRKRIYTKLREEQKEKISTALKNYYKTHTPRDLSGKNNPTAKKVLAINIDTEEIIQTFSYGKEACNFLKMGYSKFKKLIKNNGILIDKILYIYEIDFEKNK